MRPNAMTSSSVHTEHARPLAWKPFAAFGEAELIVNVDYDINVTNTSSVAEFAECGLELTDTFVTDNLCWGTDPTTPMLNLFVNETVPANATTRLTGTIELGRITFPYFPCQFVTGDPVHIAGGASALFTGPLRASISSNEWFASPFGPASQFLSVEDLGTVIRNDLSFAMTHDLPLVAGSTGCDPLRTNSTGAFGLLEAYGAVDAAEASVVLSASQLPPDSFGLFALSMTTQPATLSGFGSATLCLGAPVVRWFDSIGQTDSAGNLQMTVPPSMMPVPNGQILSGETWYFQFFHRDTDPATGVPTARSTNAVELPY